ncbi:type III secretion protein HrpB2 [Paraburkholderia humisilvae]|uniref:Type III secretion protein HrpB2 n=1 Tax=Paraburkholderia humisilvae TaxID=627669 RepID=A0A6J5EF87_9BURK|nr:type III secretion protein HrpB2 [Paraburkholderia humisilvae]CAB3764334.1 hypothetical protein LMG29542_04867 [Paraburkholderia humisilvae]
MTVNVDAKQLHALMESLSKDSGQASSGTSTELADKFQAMMDKSPTAASVEPAGDGMQTVSKALAVQDAELQKTVTDMQDFIQAAPTLSLGEISAGTMKMMMELSSAQLNLQGKMGVVESSKSAVETLMKNQ